MLEFSKGDVSMFAGSMQAEAAAEGADHVDIITFCGALGVASSPPTGICLYKRL